MNSEANPVLSNHMTRRIFDFCRDSDAHELSRSSQMLQLEYKKSRMEVTETMKITCFDHNFILATVDHDIKTTNSKLSDSQFWDQFEQLSRQLPKILEISANNMKICKMMTNFDKQWFTRIEQVKINCSADWRVGNETDYLDSIFAVLAARGPIKKICLFLDGHYEISFYENSGRSFKFGCSSMQLTADIILNILENVNLAPRPCVIFKQGFQNHSRQLYDRTGPHSFFQTWNRFTINSRNRKVTVFREAINDLLDIVLLSIVLFIIFCFLIYLVLQFLLLRRLQ